MKTFPIKSKVCRVKGSKLFLIDILVTLQSPFCSLTLQSGIFPGKVKCLEK